MATAAPSPSHARGSDNRTIITIASLIAILGGVVLLALLGKNRSPHLRLEQLQLQNELRRTGHHRRHKQAQGRGLDPSLLEYAPVLRYDISPPLERRAKSLDLERGPTGAGVESLSFAQSMSESKSMHVEMSKTTTPFHQQKSDSVRVRFDADLEQQACSICTEGFVRGELVRLLPCGHIYHKFCIDPWLLSFSGTCPVCRVDMSTLLPSTQVEDLPRKPEPAMMNESSRSYRQEIVLSP